MTLNDVFGPNKRCCFLIPFDARCFNPPKPLATPTKANLGRPDRLLGRRLAHALRRGQLLQGLLHLLPTFWATHVLLEK